jgi:hypothetical protein
MQLRRHQPHHDTEKGDANDCQAEAEAGFWGQYGLRLIRPAIAAASSQLTFISVPFAFVSSSQTLIPLSGLGSVLSRNKRGRPEGRP